MSSLDSIAREASRLLRESKYAVVFTGSGISAEAGIPTFRGKDGLWNKYRPEELATPAAFAANPLRVWKWYAWRIGLVLRAQPTIAHRAIAELEEMGIVKAVVTQNVDGLHQRAGSKNVIELHGSIMRARCTECGYKWQIERQPSDEELPLRCSKCNALARPDVVWFGEPLPSDALYAAYREFSKADLVVIVGTSGVVEPAGSMPLITLRNGGKLINVNLERNRYSGIATISYHGKSSEFFKKLMSLMR
ncbi:MAG: NAD-dependent deacylase [Desulfurococcales archaeon]|nr:NAD-dependent deacylase [Desulfurococcales archaeon]